jgi:hypothetical protein
MLIQLMITGVAGSASPAPVQTQDCAIRPTHVQLQTQVEPPPAGLLDRKRFLELSGIVAWARPELAYVLDRIGWPLRAKEWGSYQTTVERLLRLVEELNAALGDLEAEMTP